MPLTTCDFSVEVGIEGKMTSLHFRFSHQPGGIPVLVGIDSEHEEISCNVFKTIKEEPAIPKKRRRVNEEEYRRKKREIFYEEAESDSTE